MTRTHRRFHRIAWIALALLVTLGFALALGLRPVPAGEPFVPAEEVTR